MYEEPVTNADFKEDDNKLAYLVSTDEYTLDSDVLTLTELTVGSKFTIFVVAVKELEVHGELTDVFSAAGRLVVTVK